MLDRLVDYFIDYGIVTDPAFISGIEKNINATLRMYFSNVKYDRDKFEDIFNQRFRYKDNIEFAQKIVSGAYVDTRYDNKLKEFYDIYNDVRNDNDMVIYIANDLLDYMIDILSDRFEKHFKTNHMISVQN